MEKGNAAEWKRNPNTNLANSKKRSRPPMADPICVVLPSWSHSHGEDKLAREG